MKALTRHQLAEALIGLCACAMALALLLPRHWSAYALIGVVIGAGMHPHLREHLHSLRQRPAVLLLVFYVTWAWVSLLWSSSPAAGIHELLMLIPLGTLVPIAAGGLLTPSWRERLLPLLVWTALAALAWAFLGAFAHWALTGSRAKLSYHPLATLTGRSAIYLSYLLAVALCILLTRPIMARPIRIGLSLILLLGLLLLNSKTTLVAVALICAFLFLHSDIWRQRRTTAWVATLGMVMISLAAVFAAPASVRQRWQLALDSDWALLERRDFSHLNEYLPEAPLRLLLWRESLDATEGHLILGHGAGGQKAPMRQQMEALHMPRALVLFNSHNQYLQTLLTQGMVGLVLLLGSLLAALRAGWRHSTALTLLVLAAVAGLTESWLVRHDGVYLLAVVAAAFSGGASPAADTRAGKTHTDR